MATIRRLRNATHAIPFQPFTVHLIDGRSYLVKHPDFIALPAPPRGRDLAVHDEDCPHWIDLNLVVELQPAIPERGRKPKGRN